jgi:hypothetical protein
MCCYYLKVIFPYLLHLSQFSLMWHHSPPSFLIATAWLCHSLKHSNYWIMDSDNLLIQSQQLIGQMNLSARDVAFWGQCRVGNVGDALELPHYLRKMEVLNMNGWVALAQGYWNSLSIPCHCQCNIRLIKRQWKRPYCTFREYTRLKNWI